MAIDLDWQPHLFGPYYLLEQIAFGGMAEIYRARTMGASGFQRELVLKRVLPDLTENPDFLQMLSNEAKLTALLQHGNVAQVYELGLIDGTYFLTMEFLEGVSLKELFQAVARRGERLPVAQLAHVIGELCTGLDYAHRKTDAGGKPLGIVHCDVSPDNVLLSYEGVVKVLDFGIARATAAFSNHRAGMVMGKFNYVAPEQATAAGVDARSDVWACGMLLYEGLTGEHPFGHKGDVEALLKVARLEPGTIRPPRELVPELPAGLEAVVMKALAGPREQRHQSCAQLAMELAPFAGERTDVAAALQRTLHETFAARLELRRTVRAGDDEVIRSLQEEHALGAGSAPAPAPAPGRVEQEPRRPAGKSGGTSWGTAAGVGALGLFLGGGAGYLARGAPAAGAVVVADAEGATVLVDRVARGKAPLVLPELVAGRPLLVEVEASGRLPFQQTFAPEAGSLTLVDARLPRSLASLRVETDPAGARLFVDGAEAGTTPVRVEQLAIGAPHRFRLELPGFPPQEFVQALTRPENEPVKIALKR